HPEEKRRWKRRFCFRDVERKLTQITEVKSCLQSNSPLGGAFACTRYARRLLPHHSRNRRTAVSLCAINPGGTPFTRSYPMMLASPSGASRRDDAGRCR